MSTPATPIEPSVLLRDRYLRVLFADGAFDFHFRWLRHQCDADRHPTTRERVVDSREFPDDLAVRAVAVAGGVLSVIWEHDARQSRYPLDWLRAHAYAERREEVPPPPSDLARLVLPEGGAGRIARALDHVAEHGAVVLRDDGDPRPPEERTADLIASFEARGLRVIPTHFGRIEDLRTDNSTNANTDQLGYTDAGIALHTDQPFLDAPPRYQLLQSIRRADSGGESLVADGLAAFRYLQATDAEAAALLTDTPVVFHRRQQDFERTVTSPLIVDAPGHFRVRSSYFTLAPFRLPFERMEAWYRAYDRFGRLTHDPRHHYRFSLAPGEVLFYDNHRMLHGRTGFTGARWVRGVYFDTAL